MFAMYTFYKLDPVNLTSLGHLCFLVTAVSFLIFIVCATSRTFGRFMSRHFLSATPFNDPLSNKTALQQFEAQAWQLIIHISMGILGVYACNSLYQEKGFDLLGEDTNKYITVADVLEPKREEMMESMSMNKEIYCLYVTQLAVWIVTLGHLRFFEVPAADHYVMFMHHIFTISVVTLSFSMGYYVRFGLVVFMLHDLSDVPLDFLCRTEVDT